MHQIYINGRFLTQRVTGVQRYGREMLTAIDGIAGEYEGFRFTALHPEIEQENLPHLRNITYRKVGLTTGHLWEQTELPFASRGEILVNLLGIGPILHSRSVNIIHDASVFAAPEGYGRRFLAWYRFLLPLLAGRAWILGSVSAFSASEIEKYMGMSARGIEIFPNGSDHVSAKEPDLSVLARYDLRPGGYIATIGSIQANKNLQQLVRLAPKIRTELGLPVVIIGGSGRQFAAQRVPESTRDDLIFTGYLCDEEMNGILKQSFSFIFPSKYEGFGIPPIEAMALGVPVVTSNAASLPEVCGEAALYFDVDDDRAVIEALRRLKDEPVLRESLVKAGHDRSRMFSWSETARRLLDAIRKHLNDPRPVPGRWPKG